MNTFADLDDIWGYEYDEKNMPRHNKAVRELCEAAKPSDFYFHISSSAAMGYDQDDGTGCFITITPVAYFKHAECLFDETLPIDHLLPKDFSEAMESVYECDRGVQEVQQDLLKRGFLTDDQFNSLVLLFSQSL